MPTLNFDTDRLRDCSKLRVCLDELSQPNQAGCLLYPLPAIQVRLQGEARPVRVSPARVAWALAHPDDHLGVKDLAVHTCEFGTNHLNGHGDPRVCINPEHLKKGTTDDVLVMKRARARRLALQGDRL